MAEMQKTKLDNDLQRMSHGQLLKVLLSARTDIRWYRDQLGATRYKYLENQ